MDATKLGLMLQAMNFINLYEIVYSIMGNIHVYLLLTNQITAFVTTRI